MNICLFILIIIHIGAAICAIAEEDSRNKILIDVGLIIASMLLVFGAVGGY